MRAHQIRKLLAAFLSLTIASITLQTARAGGEGGGHVGGGGGWVCRETQGEIRWVRILDLDEGRRQFIDAPSIIPYGTEDQFSKYTAEQWLVRAEQRMWAGNREFHARYLEAKKNVTAVIHHVDSSDFVSTDDFDPRTRPSADETCKNGVISEQPEQLATFDDELNRLYINDRFWKHPRMMEIDRAALTMHEVIYYMYRHQANHPNSLKTRRLVGLLFSNVKIGEFKDLLSPSTLRPEGVWQPRLGSYKAIQTGKTSYYPIRIDSFDPRSGLLTLIQYNERTGRTKQRSQFECAKSVTEKANRTHSYDLYKYVCKMLDTSNWWAKRRGYGVGNHEIQITDGSILWLNLQNSGMKKATTYEAEPAQSSR